ncbi:MAG TPA: hypothetical protein VLM18_01330 [Croceibacterium sp.]|nr:hypothetical protein [Croceibacterium sp.]
MKKILMIGSALVLGLGVSACNKNPAEASADSQANAVEASADTAASQLNSQADAVESSADSQADAIKDQADKADDAGTTSAITTTTTKK